jgi:hypothetical protein
MTRLLAGVVRAVAASACVAACSATPSATPPPRAASLVASAPSPGPASPSPAALDATAGPPVSTAHPSSPSFGPPAPETVDPSLPLRGATADDGAPAETVAYTLLESSVAEAWTTSAGLFVMTARAHQGSDVGRLLPYPPRAAEAAESGRVVVMTQVWRATPGRLARVLETPTQLRPLDCIADEDCTLLGLAARLTADGAVAIDHDDCPAALAELAPAGGHASTWEAYDRAVMPAICARPKRFAWKGGVFAASAARAGAAVQVERVAPEQASTRVLEELLGVPLDEASLRVEPASDGRSQHVLVLRRVPAPANPALLPTRQADAWRSGRAIEVAELWLASYGSLRRTLTLPVALLALAEPQVVIRLEVELDGDELRVGRAGEPCRADSGFAPGVPLGDVEAAHARRDQAAADRICAGRGRYRFDRRAFTRATPARH